MDMQLVIFPTLEKWHGASSMVKMEKKPNGWLRLVCTPALVLLLLLPWQAGSGDGCSAAGGSAAWDGLPQLGLPGLGLPGMASWRCLAAWVSQVGCLATMDCCSCGGILRGKKMPAGNDALYGMEHDGHDLHVGQVAVCHAAYALACIPMEYIWVLEVASIVSGGWCDVGLAAIGSLESGK